MFFTYILKSLNNNSHYFGSTKDLDNRIKQHNNGKSKYTKSFRPWILIYSEKYNSRSEAFRRELFFKSAEGRNWLKRNNII